jgi:hypothetical protein
VNNQASEPGPVVITDPARELAELCQLLIGGAGNVPGDVYLGRHFAVQPYSTDFYRIVLAILQRFDYVESLLGDLGLDDDIKTEMLHHIRQIRSIFEGAGLQNQWSNFGANRLSPENVQPLKALSPTVRRAVSYPRISFDDADIIANDAQELLEWLAKANLADRDFIRGLLIESLQEFLFRLKHLRWVGVGYTLDGLRSVIRAYLALERGNVDPATEPVAEATLMKVGGLLKIIWEKTRFAREASETADWALKMYGACEAVSHGAPVIKALIASAA